MFQTTNQYHNALLPGVTSGSEHRSCGSPGPNVPNRASPSPVLTAIETSWRTRPVQPGFSSFRWVERSLLFGIFQQPLPWNIGRQYKHTKKMLTPKERVAECNRNIHKSISNQKHRGPSFPSPQSDQIIKWGLWFPQSWPWPWVIDGYFTGIIMDQTPKQDGLISVLTTGISGHNCSVFFNPLWMALMAPVPGWLRRETLNSR